MSWTYSAVKNSERSSRARAVNNLAKSAILGDFLYSGSTVLDLGCGRGGDLGKYQKSNVSFLLGVDRDANAISEAKNRRKSCLINKVEFIVGDAFAKKHNFGHEFDFVVSNLAFHYAFENDESLSTAFENISRHLVQEGYCIITVPNAQKVLDAAESLQRDDDLFQIFLRDKKYIFKSVDCDKPFVEPLVDQNKLIYYSRRNGLSQVKRCSFRELAEREKSDPQSEVWPIFRRSCGNLKLDKNEWSLVDLYEAIVYQKN